LAAVFSGKKNTNPWVARRVRIGALAIGRSTEGGEGGLSKRARPGLSYVEKITRAEGREASVWLEVRMQSPRGARAETSVGGGTA